MTSQYADETSETHAEDTTMSQNANVSSGSDAATSSSRANNASSSNAIIVEHDVRAGRQLHVETIPLRKRQVLNWSHNKKLCKLAVYSACQIPECTCTGWRHRLPPGYILPDDPNTLVVREPTANFTDVCRTCKHQLEKHVTQLQGESVDEINRLLGAVIDLENLYISMHLETNTFIKRGYYYLFKCLYKCVQVRSSTRIQGPLGPTPFARPSVAKAIANFILYKFNELGDSEWQIMYELAQMFLNCLNDIHLQLPSERLVELRAENTTEPIDVSVYEKNYIRWFIACYVPKYCNSLPLFETSLVFGRVLLRDVFKTVARKLVDRCQADDITPHKRAIYRRQVPQFLALFEVETYSNHSPIWNTHFHQLVDYENDMIEELHRLIPPR